MMDDTLNGHIDEPTLEGSLVEDPSLKGSIAETEIEGTLEDSP